MNQPNTQLEEYKKNSPYFADTEKMNDFTWKKFQDQIDAVPVEFYNLMVDSKTSDFIKTLTQKYPSLSVQGSDIAILVRDILLVNVFIGDIPNELVKRLGIDLNLSREIGSLIITQLFAPIIEELKKLHSQRYPGRLKDVTTPPPVPPATPKPPLNPSVQSTTPVSPRFINPPAAVKPSAPSMPTQRNMPPSAWQQIKDYPGKDLPETGGNIIDLRKK